MAQATTEGGPPSVSGGTWVKILGIFLGAVAFMVVGSGLLPGFTPLPRAPSEGSPLGGALFTLAPGALAFYLGWRHYKKVQLVLGTPRSKVRSLAVGAVEVEGEAQPVDEPLRAPLTGRDACAYELTVATDDQDGDDSSGGWSLRDHVPFAVDDGTGSVRVDPGEVVMDLEVDEEVEVPADGEPPEALVDWFESGAHLEGTLFSQWVQEEPSETGGLAGAAKSLLADPEAVQEELTTPSSKKRTFREAVLEPGESTHVWGGAYRREGADHAENPRNLVIREHEPSGTLHVSDKSEVAFAEEGLVTAAAAVAIGTVFIFFGLLILLDALGL